jgi:hypothetical protein
VGYDRPAPCQLISAPLALMLGMRVKRVGWTFGHSTCNIDMEHLVCSAWKDSECRMGLARAARGAGLVPRATISLRGLSEPHRHSSFDFSVSNSVKSLQYSLVSASLVEQSYHRFCSSASCRRRLFFSWRIKDPLFDPFQTKPRPAASPCPRLTGWSAPYHETKPHPLNIIRQNRCPFSPGTVGRQRYW